LALDAELCNVVRHCLSTDGLKLSQGDFAKLIVRIEASIHAFDNDDADRMTFRDKHDRLRELWLSTYSHAPVADIRDRLEKLPAMVMEEIDRRAPYVISRLFPSHSVVSWQALGGFRVWARQASDDDLMRAVRVLTASGARWVKGRSRSGGKRSRPRVEPDVMGVVRGAASTHGSGRPRLEPNVRLVMHLAIDWLLCTGQFPKRGRSDFKGFGKLIYEVFGWLAPPDDTSQERAHANAEYALRTYWDRVPEPSAD
jgi:hypothetical protein